MGLREYARRRGCSPSSVSRAIAEHRLVESIRRDSKGHPRIDSELADFEWTQNTDPGKQRSCSGDVREGGVIEENRRQTSLRSRPLAPDESERLPSFEESRARREAYAAKLKKLEYEEAAGILLRKDEVREAAFDVSRTIRDQLQVLPYRLGPILAVESDEFVVRARMEEEIHMALENLARLVSKLDLGGVAESDATDEAEAERDAADS